EQCIQVTILSQALCTFLGCGSMARAGSLQSCNLLGRRSVSAKLPYKVYALIANGPDGFRSPVQKCLRHGRFIGAFDSAVETKVCGLESHLYKGIWRESHGSDEVLSVARKLQNLKLVLLDEIGNTDFSKTESSSQL